MISRKALTPNRLLWLRVLRWGVVALFLLILVSWGISYLKPHRLWIVRGRKYELVMDRGMIEYWVTTQTELSADSKVVEADMGRLTDGMPRIGGLPQNSPRVSLSTSRIHSVATLQIGQEIPQMVNGKLQTLFVGQSTSVSGVPHWLIAAVLIVPVSLILLHLRHLRPRRRAAAGLCLNCGYDLRATPDRCPECGRPADKYSGPVTA